MHIDVGHKQLARLGYPADIAIYTLFLTLYLSASTKVLPALYLSTAHQLPFPFNLVFKACFNLF
jgi:hypothetical protein